MRLLFLLLAFLISTIYLPLNAETVVKGRIFEGKGKKMVEFANVGIYRNDNKLIGACASDDKGEFEIKIHKDGDYQLLISHLEFGSMVRKIHCGGGVIDLGRIFLKVDNNEIEAGKISARSLITRESDRIVYDVSKDPDAARMNISAFMSKIPGLRMSVKNGNLEFRDVPLGNILIDDRDNDIINLNRQYTMSFIRADYMSKIELILPNSPEYNNTKPIVVISLSKPLPFGAAGQIKGYSSSLNSHSLTPDAVINTPLIGIGLRYSFNYSDEPPTTNGFSRTSYGSDKDKDNTMNGSDYRNSMSEGHSINMNLFRPLFRDKIKVSASIGASKTDGNTRTLSSTEMSISGSSDSYLSSSEKTSSSPLNINAGFKADYRWKRDNHVTFKYTLKNSHCDINETLRQSHTFDAMLNNSKKRDFQNNITVAAKLRPNRRIGLMLESGYMFRDYEDKAAYWNGNQGGMDYKQSVAYANAMLMGSVFKRRLGYSLALSTESVINKGMNVSTSRSLDYHELNLIPKITLSWRVLKNYQLWSSYTCMSRRPRQEQLDPYRDMSDPYNINVGNLNLKGEITHTFSGAIDKNFTIKWIDNLSIQADYSSTPNSIELISSVEDNNVRTISYANIGRRSTIKFSAYGAFRPAKIFKISLNASYSRTRYCISEDEINDINTFSLSQSASLDFKFAYISQSLIVYPQGLTAQSRAMRPEPLMDLAISRYWEKAHIGGTIGFEDLLHGRSIRKTSISAGDFTQESWIQRTGRRIYFSIYWRIGKFKQTDTVKHSSYDLD